MHLTRVELLYSDGELVAAVASVDVPNGKNSSVNMEFTIDRGKNISGPPTWASDVHAWAEKAVRGILSTW